MAQIFVSKVVVIVTFEHFAESSTITIVREGNPCQIITETNIPEHLVRNYDSFI